jgi:hypothetical protein
MIKEIAAWMLDEVVREGLVEQETMAAGIETRFGSEYVPVSDSGNLSVRRDILDEFKRISKDSVVYHFGEKCWRRRESQDSPGRLQV